MTDDALALAIGRAVLAWCDGKTNRSVRFWVALDATGTVREVGTEETVRQTKSLTGNKKAS